MGSSETEVLLFSNARAINLTPAFAGVSLYALLFLGGGMSKRVVVTGGARGIGAAVVRRVAASGYNVLFTYHGSQDKALGLLDELKAEWPEQDFAARQLDLGMRTEVEAFAGELLKSTDLYGFVHNAGMSYDALCALIKQDRAEALMQVNFWSLTKLAASAIRPMMRAKAGRVVAVGSVTAWKGTPGNAAYAASKGAIHAYIKTLAMELSGKGVTANAVAPGFVDTDLMAPYAAQRSIAEKQIPLGRYAQPQEIAGLIGYLLSEEAGYITGDIIPIDGGLGAGGGFA
jgi:3-oxoacyl-[acyl-carrier protein] reductase